MTTHREDQAFIRGFELRPRREERDGERALRVSGQQGAQSFTSTTNQPSMSHGITCPTYLTTVRGHLPGVSAAAPPQEQEEEYLGNQHAMWNTTHDIGEVACLPTATPATGPARQSSPDPYPFAFDLIFSDDRLPFTNDEADYASRQLQNLCENYMREGPAFTQSQFSTCQWLDMDGSDGYYISINRSGYFLPLLQLPGEEHDVSLQDRLVDDHVIQGLYSYASIDLGTAQLDEEELGTWYLSNGDRILTALHSLKAAVANQQLGTHSERHQLHSSVWWSDVDGQASWLLSRGPNGDFVDCSYTSQSPDIQASGDHQS